MAFNFEDVTRKILDNVRTQTERRILEIAAEVKTEMGSDADKIEYEYEPGDIHSTDSLGTLKVKGASEQVCIKFRDTVLSRFHF